MLLAGDEFGRTQDGNNNAYCQDNEISWLDWHDIQPKDSALQRLRGVISSISAGGHRVFSRPRFFRGEMLSEAGLKDITWVTPAGVEATGEDSGNPVGQALGYVLVRRRRRILYPRRNAGHRRELSGDDERLDGDLDFHFPRLPTLLIWEALVDTAEPTGRAEPDGSETGEAYLLRAYSFALFINGAPALPQMARAAFPSPRAPSDDTGGDCSLPKPVPPKAEEPEAEEPEAEDG